MSSTLRLLKRINSWEWKKKQLFEEDSNQGMGPRIASKVIKSPLFDYVMGAIITFNMGVMIVETDRSADGEDGNARFHWSELVGWCILVIFVLELLLRLYGQGCRFWRDPWNRFDFLIVVTDSLFSIIGFLFGKVFPVITLRVCRLAKLARITKVLRVFPELRTMMSGLVGSISAIFWGAILLLLVLLIWAMVAVIFIHPVIKHVAFEDCTRCPRAYDSVWSSMLTLWQTVVAGESWDETAVPLIEEHPSAAIYFIAVHLTVALGVLNLILGVVCNVFTLAHERIVKEIEDEKRMHKLEIQKDLLTICKNMDADGDGELTVAEVEIGYRENRQFRETVQSLDVTETDLEMVWAILDNDKSGKVSYGEFVSQIYKMQSSDTQFMLAYIKYYVSKIKDAILQQMEAQNREMLRIEQDSEKVLGNMMSMTKQIWDSSDDTMPTYTALHHGEPCFVTDEKGEHSQESISESKKVWKDSHSDARGKPSDTAKRISNRFNGRALQGHFHADFQKLQLELKDDIVDLRRSIDGHILSIGMMVRALLPLEKQMELQVPNYSHELGVTVQRLQTL